ncbi:hypothetical protein CLI76_04590 [Porphyromonas gingivalis]|nr:hypothetical protein CLI76_04590 [Porphyromonas gingivalis]
MVTCGSIFIIRIACKDKKGQASGKDNKEKRVFRAVTGSKSESYFPFGHILFFIFSQGATRTDEKSFLLSADYEPKTVELRCVFWRKHAREIFRFGSKNFYFSLQKKSFSAPRLSQPYSCFFSNDKREKVSMRHR